MADSIMEKRMNSINRGAYWFGIIGRLSIFLGLLSLLGGVLMLVSSRFAAQEYAQGIGRLTDGAQFLIYGWLFVLGRDAFQAIKTLLYDKAQSSPARVA